MAGGGAIAARHPGEAVLIGQFGIAIDLVEAGLELAPLIALCAGLGGRGGRGDQQGGGNHQGTHAHIRNRGAGRENQRGP